MIAKANSFSTALVCIVMILFLGACNKDSDEARIKHALSILEQGLEKRDAATAISVFSKEYRDQAGRDTRATRSMMFVYFSRNQKIEVLTGNLSIEVKNSDASVKLDVVLLGGKNIIPERGQQYQVDMQWRKQGDDWRLYRAAWVAGLWLPRQS